MRPGHSLQRPCHWRGLGQVQDELLSPKDTTSPLLKDSDCNFVYEEEQA